MRQPPRLIALVDDDPISLNLMHKLLTEAGYRTVVEVVADPRKGSVGAVGGIWLGCGAGADGRHPGGTVTIGRGAGAAGMRR